jgi:hypothetical protein
MRDRRCLEENKLGEKRKLQILALKNVEKTMETREHSPLEAKKNLEKLYHHYQKTCFIKSAVRILLTYS